MNAQLENKVLKFQRPADALLAQISAEVAGKVRQDRREWRRFENLIVRPGLFVAGCVCGFALASVL